MIDCRANASRFAAVVAASRYYVFQIYLTQFFNFLNLIKIYDFFFVVPCSETSNRMNFSPLFTQREISQKGHT